MNASGTGEERKMLILPDKAALIINMLEQRGYQAYAVGGCIRDTLIGLKPADWDIAASALPMETMEVFARYEVIPTGVKHGTVTVIIDNEPFEITTFRKDGPYSEHRRPERVSFVDGLEEDLKRRDFTFNALAYNPHRGLVDFFGGEADLRAGIIKCVGEPEERFEEDALRIMRALRFASVYNFSLEYRTGLAVNSCAGYLSSVSAERINAEFNKLIMGPGFYSVMDKWGETVYFALNMPPADRIRLKAAALAPANLEERLSLLFENGVIASKVLTGLRYDKKTVRGAAVLAEHINGRETDAQAVKRMLGKIGREYYLKLLDVRQACERASGVKGTAECTRAILNGILERGECVSLKELAIKGGDICAIAQGPLIGQILSRLLEEVITERLPNERTALLRRAGELAGRI